MITRHHYKNTFQILKETYLRASKDNVFKLSASLAYYTIFSLPPLVILIFSLFGWVFGDNALEGQIYSQINALVGDKLALKIQNIITSITLSKEFTGATIIGIFTLILGATGIFTEIQDSLNHIWCIRAKPKRGWQKIIANRLISFFIVVSIGLLLLGSLLFNAALLALSNKLAHYYPDLAIRLVFIANYILTFGIITLLFAVIFKVLPDAKIRWRDVMVGALWTALLFIIGKFVIGFYLSKMNINSIFSTVQSGILILLWIYYSSIILYFGAEFTHIYAERFGKKIQPADYAVLVKNIEIEAEA